MLEFYYLFARGSLTLFHCENDQTNNIRVITLETRLNVLLPWYPLSLIAFFFIVKFFSLRVGV